MRIEIADAAYALVRDLLERCPELFSMTRDGLVVQLAGVDEHVVCDGVTRSVAVTAGLRDRWLLRATLTIGIAAGGVWHRRRAAGLHARRARQSPISSLLKRHFKLRLPAADPECER